MQLRLTASHRLSKSAPPARRTRAHSVLAGAVGQDSAGTP